MKFPKYKRINELNLYNDLSYRYVTGGNESYTLIELTALRADNSLIGITMIVLDVETISILYSNCSIIQHIIPMAFPSCFSTGFSSKAFP